MLILNFVTNIPHILGNEMNITHQIVYRLMLLYSVVFRVEFHLKAPFTR